MNSRQLRHHVNEIAAILGFVVSYRQEYIYTGKCKKRGEGYILKSDSEELHFRRLTHVALWLETRDESLTIPPESTLTTCHYQPVNPAESRRQCFAIPEDFEFSHNINDHLFCKVYISGKGLNRLKVSEMLIWQIKELFDLSFTEAKAVKLDAVEKTEFNQQRHFGFVDEEL